MSQTAQQIDGISDAIARMACPAKAPSPSNASVCVTERKPATSCFEGILNNADRFIAECYRLVH